MVSGIVYFAEKNIHGAWVIYGVAGVKQYYGYTKKQAIEKYKESCGVIPAKTK